MQESKVRWLVFQLSDPSRGLSLAHGFVARDDESGRLLALCGEGPREHALHTVREADGYMKKCYVCQSSLVLRSSRTEARRSYRERQIREAASLLPRLELPKSPPGRKM